MKTLKFASDLVALVLDGSKTSTWRLFDDKDLIKGDALSLIDKSTGEEFAKAEITSIKETTLGQLTDEDREGHEPFESDQQMYETYEKYYNTKVGPETSLKIIRFELLK